MLPLSPLLPEQAQQAHVFPKLASNSLLSVATLCDAGCQVTFNRDKVQVTKATQHILQGSRQPNGLWTMPVGATTAPQLNVLTHKQPHTRLADHLAFLHAAAFSPVTSTLIDAINNNQFTTWPNFTAPNIRKHLPPSIATAKGHMDQIRQNIQSTNKPMPLPTTPLTERTHHIYAAVIDTWDTTTGQIASDLTGKFPTISSKGNQYILVIYDYDSNSILPTPLKNRNAATILQAYKDTYDFLQARGLKPRLQRLDNEASKLLKDEMYQRDIDFQLAPPDIHRRNSAERAIRTFKNHFIAGLTSTDPDFPIHLWDRLIEQAALTLNLLRRSHINPRLSAYAQLNGQFDFNRTPLAPPGTRVLFHQKAAKRGTWAPHSQEGWYVGPAMEHYRCYRIYFPQTRAERIVDTVEFFPTKVPVPATSSLDRLIDAAKQLTDAIRKPHPAVPFQPLDTDTHANLQKLADIFTVRVAPRVKDDVKAHTPTSLPTISPPPDIGYKVPIAPNITPTTTPNPETFIEDLDVLTTQQCNALAPIRAQHSILRQPDIALYYEHMSLSVIDPDTGKSLEYRDLIRHPKLQSTWLRSAANEFGRLAQGVGDRIKGTNTMHFIHPSEIPEGRTVTYARHVCDIRPQKAEQERTRITVGGNLIDYPGEVSTRTADLTTVKVHVNSVVSTPNAEYMCMDVKNYYLGTPLPRKEYMRFRLTEIPMEIRLQYNLDAIAVDGWVYVAISKGMYGLPQAGLLANQQLERRLAKHGYFPCTHTPGLWKHKTRPISFTLVVDDFGVKYVGKEHALHLAAALKENYEVTMDWSGSLYVGIRLKWDYTNRTVTLHMPGYVQTALKRFTHPPPSKPVHAPYKAPKKQYGVKVQLTEPTDDSTPLTPSQKKTIQQIIGTFLYYARAVDPTMVVALSTLAAEQAHATAKTQAAINQFLDYCHTHPSAAVTYTPSEMILHVHSDASYLSEPKARSRAGGYFFLGNHPDKPDKDNGPILNPTGVIKVVLSSAAEAETAALFTNMKEAVILRTMLDEMGHPQPPTPVQVDNSTACGIANDNIKQQRSKAIDMRFYWVRDRVDQGQFKVFWKPGAQDKADYFTKHHAAKHHITVRPLYVQDIHPEASNLSYCEGVLIPNSSRPRDHRDSTQDPSNARQPTKDESACMRIIPLMNAILTIARRTHQQAKSLNKLII